MVTQHSGDPPLAHDQDRTRTFSADQPSGALGPALEAGLAAAFGPDSTPGGCSQPPLLRDDPSENAPLVQPTSPDMPRGSDERYQMLGAIARGGMGVVLKGRGPDLGRDLAFKVLRAKLTGKPAAVHDSLKRPRSVANFSLPKSCRSTTSADSAMAAHFSQ